VSSKVAMLVENVYVIPGRTNIGIIAFDRECIIVDTGLDEDYGRKIYNIVVRELNLKPRAIVNTHSHADHIGGNLFLVKRLNVEVYTSSLEKPFIELPLIEPLYLYGGFPPQSYLTKLITAAGVPVKDIEELVKELSIEVVDLSGHSLGMIGVSVNGVLFAGDSIFSREVLMKYAIPYHLNPQKAYETMGKLLELSKSFKFIVPSHGSPATGAEAIKLIEENMKAVESVKNTVLQIVSENPDSIEEITAKVLNKLNLKPANQVAYLLYRSAIASYISWLINEDLVKDSIADNKLVFTKQL